MPEPRRHEVEALTEEQRHQRRLVGVVLVDLAHS